MKNSHKTAAVALVTAILAGMSVQSAFAETVDQDPAVSSVQEASPSSFTNVATATVSGDPTKVQLENLGSTAILPTDPSGAVVIDTPGGTSIGVDLPFAHQADNDASTTAGTASYDNNNGSTTVVVAHTDASIQFSTVISNADAPTSYSYSLDLPAGATLQAATEGGSVSVLNSDGSWIGGIAAPWAKDANGASVATHYDISGTTLIQIVDLDPRGIAYPVVADPWLGVALISSVTWVAGDQWGPTAQIVPTSAGRDAIFAPAAANEAAWGEALEKTTRSKLDHNNLHDQFTCHWLLVRLREPNKSSWNLDSKRPDVGLARTTAAGCNPGGGKED